MTEMLRRIKRVFFPPEHIIVRRFWKRREAILHAHGIKRLLVPFKMLANSRTLVRYNASIPASERIRRFAAPHGLSGIFISAGASVGDGCVIFHQVTIGSNTLRQSSGTGVPRVGNNVYIGAGAKIIGDVAVGDGARIGANCVVTSDVPENATVVLPKPRVILHDGPRDNTFVSMEDYMKELEPISHSDDEPEAKGVI